MKVKFHPEARVELREAKRWYRDRSPMVAIAFAHTIEHAIHEIVAAPHRYPTGEHDTRHFVIPRRFPYTVVYRIRQTDIVIVAIAHQSREPEYWRDR
ncbi:MAG TPA: type II toxin-antitoxin system RelE/ParE family toxin [Thermoanaerobaculia bacterium]|nr:type II toxin-antitoxin system RelE/ParE family toxin [Thermoanaerobaculia bacterium]